MSVLIKGINKPTNCFLCHLSYMRTERLFCYLTNEEIIGAKIASECPLIPVPNHGRLIDASELQKTIHEHDYLLKDVWNTTDNGMFTIGIDYAIFTAPTIIPSDEDGE